MRIRVGWDDCSDTPVRSVNIILPCETHHSYTDQNVSVLVRCCTPNRCDLRRYVLSGRQSEVCQTGRHGWVFHVVPGSGMHFDAKIHVESTLLNIHCQDDGYTLQNVIRSSLGK